MIRRIQGILLQEYYLLKGRLEIIIDLFWFSIMSIIVVGFIANYVTSSDSTIADTLLLGTIFWEVIRIGQYSLSVGPLWNIWSRNLSNLFRTPLSSSEYLIALMISSFAKSVFVFIINVLLLNFLFHFDILRLGLANLIFYVASLLLFSWSVGMLLLGVIFLFGTRIQALAWGSIFALQPLTAAFYPVSALPHALQYVSYIFPTTYIFEHARHTLQNQPIDPSFISISLVLNGAYFLASLYFFNVMFQHSHKSGQFARNDNL